MSSEYYFPPTEYEIFTKQIVNIANVIFARINENVDDCSH